VAHGIALSEIDACLDRSADDVAHAPYLARHLGETDGGLQPHQTACATLDMSVRFAFRERVAVPLY
jgi:hypothetical protein